MFPDNFEKSVREYERLFTAIKAGNEDEARELLSRSLTPVTLDYDELCEQYPQYF